MLDKKQDTNLVLANTSSSAILKAVMLRNDTQDLTVNMSDVLLPVNDSTEDIAK